MIETVEVGKGERVQQKCYDTQEDHHMHQNYLEKLLGKDHIKALSRFIAI